MKTKERSAFGPRDVRVFSMDAAAVGEFAQLSLLGIGLSESTVRRMMAVHSDFVADAMASGAYDNLVNPLLPASIATPVQFLQQWLPGFVRTMTTPRKIDSLIGVSNSGSWEDEEVVQGVMEPVGKAVIYSDNTNVPLSGFNLGFERRTVVRYEKGMGVGALEEARAARINANTAAEKRGAAALAIDIMRNKIGFYGFNNGSNRTYGFLNDPALPAYVNVAAGGSAATEWSSKTYLEIVADIREILASLRVQSRGVIDVRKAAITLGLPLAAVDYLSVVSEHGNSVADWLKSTYPNVRVDDAPELDAANGGENVMYAYAETVEDGASDDSRTWIQIVPAKFQMLGVEKQAKRYVEDYIGASAGVMLKRPYAVQRRSGI
jgi:hypothetical protein